MISYLNKALGAPTQQSSEFPILHYEHNVIIDSGASNHMTPDQSLLTDIETAYKQVIMSENSAVPADEQGILRLSIFYQKHKQIFIVPLYQAYMPTSGQSQPFCKQGIKCILPIVPYIFIFPVVLSLF